jgi:DNA-directed RNA polymerase alpha subunit
MLSTIRIPDEIYDIPLEKIRLSKRVYNSLTRGGMTKVGHILTMSDEELSFIRNLGPLGLQSLTETVLTAGILPHVSHIDAH